MKEEKKYYTPSIEELIQVGFEFESCSHGQQDWSKRVMDNERRREIGLLRAFGANRNFIFRLFLTEGSVLGLGGGIIGVLFAVILVYLFRVYIMVSAELPLLIPPLPSLLLFMLACLVIALVLALPALLYPAMRASRIDPSVAMREV